LAVLLLALGLWGPAARAAVDPFTVSGVTVDATAATAAAARDTALAEGQRKAFRQLLERLAAPADYGRLPHPSDTEITSLIAGFQVQEERASAVRYLATLTYSFRPNAVRALLRGAGVRVAETASRPVLLVPLLKRTAGVELWEPTNQWRQVWLDRPPATGLVPVVVPTGTPEDVAALSTAQAQSGDPAGCAALLQHYDAGEAMIAEATLDAAGVQIVLRRPGSPDPVLSDRLAQTGVESQTELLRRAAVRVVQGLEERWKRETVVQPQDDTGDLIVRVALQGMNDWLEVRRRLAATGFVQGVSVKSLSRREAVVGLSFAGDANQLKLVLAQRQLDLQESADGWTLRVLGTGAGAGTGATGQTGERVPTAR
jgi:hypothetical protein